MFEGNEEELKETKVTQPAIFLHSVILSNVLSISSQADMVALDTHLESFQRLLPPVIYHLKMG